VLGFLFFFSIYFVDFRSPLVFPNGAFPFQHSLLVGLPGSVLPALIVGDSIPLSEVVRIPIFSPPRYYAVSPSH